MSMEPRPEIVAVSRAAALESDAPAFVRGAPRLDASTVVL
jgi:hypothetical protein